MIRHYITTLSKLLPLTRMTLTMFVIHNCIIFIADNTFLYLK